MRKRLLAFILAIVLFLSLPCDWNCTIDKGHISVELKQSQVQAASVITVKKADKATVTKIHKQLIKGKAINLKIKGNASASKKLLNKVRSSIKKVNEQGVVFQYKKGKTSRGYTTYTVNSDQAGTYMYAAKFIKKLYSLVRNTMVKDENFLNYYADFMKYPDQKTRRLRWVYDDIVEMIYSSPICLDEKKGEFASVDPTSYDMMTTKYDAGLDAYPTDELKVSLIKDIKYTYTFTVNYYDRSTYEYHWQDIVYEFNQRKSEKELEQLRVQCEQKFIEDGFSYVDISIYSSVSSKGYTFDEFCKLPVAQEMEKTAFVYSRYNDASIKLYRTKKFCDLSDAMKVYAIDQSGYFDCRMKRDGYGMVYDMTAAFYGKKGMKTLYNNKATGVCSGYAVYEKQVWDALGIKNYINLNYKISHGWSVVAAKNAKGKTLWIPFDYGIGPSEGLAVSDSLRKKYLRTESMRYKLYLKGIKGAPSKKNFKDSDFN